MKTQRYWLVLVGVLFWGAFSRPAAAQEVRASEVAAAIAEAWDNAREPPDLGDKTIRWRLELLYVPPMKELEELRRSVPGRPDHPMKHQLAAYEERLQGNPTSMPRQLLIRSADKWRWGRELKPDTYIDTVVSGKNRWQMTPKVLRIFPRAGAGDDGRDPAVEYNIFWPELGRLLTGGFSSGVRAGFIPETPSVDEDGNWEFIASTVKPETPDRGVKIKYVGTYDSSAQSLLVISMEIVAHSHKPESVGKVTLFSDWSWQKELGAWVCGTARTIRPDGRPDRQLVFESVRDDGPSFADAVQMPESDSVDAVRGAVTYERIVDFRKNQIEDVASGDTMAFQLEPVSSKSSEAFKWIGWGSAGVLTAALVALRLRRRMS
ncbi:MAG: hypothetical protein Q9O74_11270 [Planctomycetota bacterium]|nr:hypothetical protein [Planctomycetota bacterium]